MLRKNRWPCGIVFALLFSLSAEKTQAAQARFHYIPTDACGNTTMKPAGGGVGERVRWFGAVREPYQNQPRPTHLVTFRHPYTGRNVSVPLAFPEGTPNIMYRRDRVIYNYGSYTVEAHFLPDGSVDVVYNSGLLREL